MARILNIEDFLKNYYYNIYEPTSLQGAEKLYKAVKSVIPSITRKYVKNWLRKQETYTVHRPAKLNFKRNPIVSKTIDHNWHGDLVEISHPKSNNNYRYILMIIDNLSKYGWARLLKDKKAETIKKAFLSILKESKRKPQILTTDAGKEFKNHSFRKYLKWRKIKHLVVKDFAKAAVVERWNRTIKEKINKYLTFKNTKRFIDVFPYIISGYNNTIHSRTKFKPIDVNPTNQRKVFQNLYKIRQTLNNKIFSIGDKVRLFLIRDKFAKGYLPNYSKEIFIVHKILFTSPYLKYKVRDKRGTILRGSYYSNEMIKV